MLDEIRVCKYSARYVFLRNPLSLDSCKKEATELGKVGKAQKITPKE